MVKLKQRKEHLNNTSKEIPEISEEDFSDDLSDDDIKDICLIGYTRDKFLKMIDDELDELGL